jgi:major intracellular serine protease
MADSYIKPIFPEIPFNSQKMSWGHKWLELPLIWTETQALGQGITIAVIDTGITPAHPDLQACIDPRSRSFSGNEEDITDKDGHGTKMSGIISASGNHFVFGVAPRSRIVVLKAAEYARGADPLRFAEALEFGATLDDVQIISFSHVFNDHPDLKTGIESCLSKGKIVFAAAGNGRNLDLPESPDQDLFPACYDGVLSVGAFDKKGKVCTFSNWSEHLDFLAPGDNGVLTSGTNGQRSMGGQTSIATAFAAGCFALLLSFARDNDIPVNQCLSALLSHCDDVGPTIGRDFRSGHGLLNLRNTLKSLLI